MTASFKDLLTQLAEAHEREVAALQKQISGLQPASSLDTDTPEQPHRSSSETPPSSQAQPNAPEATGDSNEDCRSNSQNSQVAEDAEPMRLMSGWLQVPPKFTNLANPRLPSMNRRVVSKLTDDTGRGDETGVISSCVLDPGSTERMSWDVFGMILIGYDMITIPLMCFGPDDSSFATFMSWLAMIFWTLDMVGSLSTGYRLSNGNVVMDRKLIARNYVKSWLIIDILVVVPDWTFTLISIAVGPGEDSPGGGGTTRMLRILRAIRIVRLLRIAKLKKLLQIVYDSVDSEYIFIILNLSQLILIVLVMNHYVACVWYGIGELSRTGGSDTGLNWLEHSGKTPVITQKMAWRYVTSLHWSITQFTPASMDVSAVNLAERSFSIAILFMSLVSLSSIIGSVTASMTALRNLKGEQTKQFWMLRRYLREKGTSRSLKERILRYCEYQTERVSTTTPSSKVPLLLMLSEPLKRELSTCLYSPTLSMHPVFVYLGYHMPKMHERICETISMSSYGEADFVFRGNEVAGFMYFIKNGIFDYMLSGTQTPREPPLESKEWLVEIALWTTEWRYRGDLICRDAGDLLLIGVAAFARAMRLHPRSWHFGRIYGAKMTAHINSMDRTTLTDFTFEDDITNILQDSDVYDDTGSHRLTTSEALQSSEAEAVEEEPSNDTDIRDV